MLIPLTAAHYDELFAMISAPGIGSRWRYQGHAPTRDEFVARVWDGVLEQAVMRSSVDGSLVGLVSAYNADARNGHCSIAVVSDEAHLGTGAAIVGAARFIQRLFAEWPFRFLRIEAHEYSLEQFRSIVGSIAKRDGVLREHSSWDGELHDLHILRIERADWEDGYHRFIGPSLRRFTAPVRPACGAPRSSPKRLPGATDAPSSQ